MTNGASGGHLAWAHVGDLHITNENESNYHDFVSIIDTINTHLAGHIDFCVLPGDNADDGTSDQYALIRSGLDRLQVPVHVIPGDHDRKPGSLRGFYQGLGVEHLPYAMTAGGCRCVFLDVVSQGSGGPDFALGCDQLSWLKAELECATSLGLPSVVFMHAYPADLTSEHVDMQRLLSKHRVKVVDMGHTHYNELANDGTTIFTTTRSTGQIEEGAVGLSLTTLHEGVVNWRFKPLVSSWPFVMILSPADHRLLTDVGRGDRLVSGAFVVVARVWSGTAVAGCRCRIDDSSWMVMHPAPRAGQWQACCDAPGTQFELTVEAVDQRGNVGSDTLTIAVPGHRPPERFADGSDADAIGPWPDRHLLGTRLGPNRNGRQW